MYSSKSFICLICSFLLMGFTAFAQSIKVIDFPNLKPLPNSNVFINGKNIGTTNNDGIYIIEQKGQVSISYLGYITQTFQSPKTDTTIILLPASILLDEVRISPSKEKIIGYFGKWGNGIIHGVPNFNSSIVNSFKINDTTKLKSFLFYIPNYPNSQVNIPFEFVIFKEINGKYSEMPLKIPIRIEQYDYLWNSYSLTSANLKLEPGNYLFGMRWIKSRVNENPKHKNIRQSLGTINKGITDINSYRSTPNKGWKLLTSSIHGKTIYSIALLGLIVED